MLTGLDIDHVALIEVDPETARYDAARARSYLDSASAALATLPGVQAAGFGRIIPLGFGGSRMSVVVPDIVRRPTKTWSSTTTSCRRRIATRRG